MPATSTSSSPAVQAAALLWTDRETPAPRSSAPARRPLMQPLADVDMGALLRFRSMMALAGEPVQVARMCFDRRYAYERIAAAHAAGPDPLQRLALELFQAYHRRDESRLQRPSA